MSRLQADLLLIITAIIWGAAFVAQKESMESIGPFTFTGTRFLLSALVISPFAFQEFKKRKNITTKPDKLSILLLCFVFFSAVATQQIGLLTTTITNAGFLTSLYVIFTPILSLLIFKIFPQKIIWIAAPICILGVWLLGEGSLTVLNIGDGLVTLSGLLFALHTVLISFIVVRTRQPMTLAFFQYAACAVLGLVVSFCVEEISLEAIQQAMPYILFTGILSGGVAYSFQIIAQQHTPSSDAAIILSGEALIAALAGALIMGDNLSPIAWSGCALIFIGILTVEVIPYFRKKP